MSISVLYHGCPHWTHKGHIIVIIRLSKACALNAAVWSDFGFVSNTYEGEGRPHSLDSTKQHRTLTFEARWINMAALRLAYQCVQHHTCGRVTGTHLSHSFSCLPTRFDTCFSFFTHHNPQRAYRLGSHIFLFPVSDNLTTTLIGAKLTLQAILREFATDQK